MPWIFLAMVLLLAQPAAAGGLAGSEWQPAGAGFGTESGRREFFLRFAAGGRVVGRSGCNRFSGAYRSRGRGLKIGPLMSTRMACAPELMRGERRFLRALERSRSFQITGYRLRLFGASGAVLMKLRRRDFD